MTTDLLAALPADRPFTYTTARECGASKRQLAALVSFGLLRRPLRGVYVVAQLPDSLWLRTQILHLVVPPGCFVCDDTAAWLWGAKAALAPNAHLELPRVSCFRRSDAGRLRNRLTVSGEREIRDSDLTEVNGILVTTPLRTALDLGRLQRTRDLRLAGMDAMLRVGGFTHDELLAGVDRFRGRRGVVLLRALAPLADAGAQSQAESALRLRWYDAGLPRPRLQTPVVLPDGGTRFLDMALEDWLFAAEYDGEAFHTGDSQVEHDTTRRDGLHDLSWVVEVFTKANVYGIHQDADLRLRRAFAAARASYSSRVFIV